MTDVAFPAPRLLAVDPQLPVLALREMRDYMAAIALSRDPRYVRGDDLDDIGAIGDLRARAFAAAVAAADAQLEHIVALLRACTSATASRGASS